MILVAKYLLLDKKGVINVVMHKDSTATDVLKAFIHALVMAKLNNQGRSVHSESQLWIDKHYEVFVLKVRLRGRLGLLYCAFKWEKKSSMTYIR